MERSKHFTNPAEACNYVTDTYKAIGECDIVVIMRNEKPENVYKDLWRQPIIEFINNSVNDPRDKNDAWFTEFSKVLGWMLEQFFSNEATEETDLAMEPIKTLNYCLELANLPYRIERKPAYFVDSVTIPDSFTYDIVKLMGSVSSDGPSDGDNNSTDKINDIWNLPIPINPIILYTFANDTVSVARMHKELNIGLNMCRKIFEVLDGIGIISERESTRPRRVLVDSIGELKPWFIEYLAESNISKTAIEEAFYKRHQEK